MSTPRYTPQQTRALTEKSVSIALSAGAGCGKTFVLTRRFLGYLKPGPEQYPLTSLVAITFTDKAAREMRDRVRATCLQRVRECPPEEADHWLSLLRDLDRARISTIHSFCGNILRSHAIASGLDPEFTTLEASVADSLLRQSIEATATRLLVNDQPAFRLLAVDYGIEKLLESSGVLVRQRQLITFADFDEMTAEELAGIWQRWLQETGWPALVRQIEHQPTFVRLSEFISRTSANTPKLDEKLKILRLIMEQLKSQQDSPVPGRLEELFAELTLQARVVGVKPDHWGTPDDHELAKELFTQVRDECKKLIETIQLAQTEFVPYAEKSLAWLSIAGESIRDYELLKKSRACVDFDDLLVLSRDLLRNDLTVRQALSRSIRVLMVDEFQDTDPVQADLVEMICGKELTTGKLFLVGDQKQSIYRFRGADPLVFRSLKSKIPAAGQLPLTMNFRSQPPILHFVNILFRRVMGADYEALEPSFADEKPELERIEFLWATTDVVENRAVQGSISRKDSTAQGLADEQAQDAADTESRDVADGDDDSRSDSGEKQTAPFLRRREADWIARRILELLADPTPRIREKSGHWRTIVPGDITILFRALTNLEVYEQALEAAGIDYYVAGGRAFFAQQEIYDLAHLCQFLDDPEDGFSLVGLLRSPFFCFSDPLIHRLASRAGGITQSLFAEASVVSGLSPEESAQVEFAAQTLGSLVEQRDHWPLARIIRRALELTGYEAIVAQEFLGSRKLANVHKAIELSRQFDLAGGSRAEFVTQLRESIDQESREELAATHPESSSVVRLMSIHQSKGLEFPVVFVADMNRPRKTETLQPTLHPRLGALVTPSNPLGERQKHPVGQFIEIMEEAASLEEYQRLLYVAATRARDLLILSAGIKGFDEGKFSPWMLALKQVFHLETGLLRNDPWFASGHEDVRTPQEIPLIRTHHQPPQFIDHGVHRQGLHKLSFPQVWNELELAESLPWPQLVADVQRDAEGRRRLSVSRLEEFQEQSSSELKSFVPAGELETQSASLSRSDAELLGEMIHGVLERFEPRAEEDSEKSLLQRLWLWCQRQPAPPGGQILEQAQQWLKTFASTELIDELAMASELHRELEFSLDWKLTGAEPIRETEIYGLIDVLMKDSQDDWIILDYKTSRVAAGATDELLLQPYRLQLGTYALAVQRLFGRLPQKAELIFMRPTPRRVVWNMEQVLVSDLERLVTEAINQWDAAQASSSI
ncbi:UvrD-helicase domain-containing protein [Planctopirus hydrillae]|uniref:DNA 3'-5' helicase n=1 Tax=Planctopirus hydrillae TaxID=1841610 RepID=A0A1C3E7T6_9PLAN|nr:UvrD-helicase domain-containing protein [Planctopirus hydrillae]ODA29291.1 hypothetical protein A6X21_09345 [Planctopirus hydrillae]